MIWHLFHIITVTVTVNRYEPSLREAFNQSARYILFRLTVHTGIRSLTVSHKMLVALHENNRTINRVNVPTKQNNGDCYTIEDQNKSKPELFCTVLFQLPNADLLGSCI